MTTQNSVPGKGAGQIVADARETIPEITVAQARQEWEQGQVALLLDVREPGEWGAPLRYVIACRTRATHWCRSG